MAETANFATMADLVSTDIFGTFGWTVLKPRNQNWDCARDDHVVAPNKRKAKGADPTASIDTGGAGGDSPDNDTPKPKRTHPTDIVFRYADPYRDGLIFVQTDLKSYGADSIKRDELAGALRSLCQATECANVAEGWKKLYEEPNTSYQVCGLLFVYNHDEKFTASKFPSMLEDASEDNVKIVSPHRVFVIGPSDVLYLANVASSLRRQQQLAGTGAEIETYYPDLVLRRSRTTYSAAATIETLLAPWQVFFLKTVVSGSVQRRTLVYYRERGASIEEFEYLFEYLFRHHVALFDGDVEVRLPDPDDHAPTLFEQAKATTFVSMHSLPEFRARLDRIKYLPISTVTTRFSPLVVGMGSHE